LVSAGETVTSPEAMKQSAQSHRLPRVETDLFLSKLQKIQFEGDTSDTASETSVSTTTLSSTTSPFDVDTATAECAGDQKEDYLSQASNESTDSNEWLSNHTSHLSSYLTAHSMSGQAYQTDVKFPSDCSSTQMDKSPRWGGSDLPWDEELEECVDSRPDDHALPICKVQMAKQHKETFDNNPMCIEKRKNSQGVAKNHAILPTQTSSMIRTETPKKHEETFDNSLMRIEREKNSRGVAMDHAKGRFTRGHHEYSVAVDNVVKNKHMTEGFVKRPAERCDAPCNAYEQLLEDTSLDGESDSDLETVSLASEGTHGTNTSRDTKLTNESDVSAVIMEIDYAQIAAGRPSRARPKEKASSNCENYDEHNKNDWERMIGRRNASFESDDSSSFGDLLGLDFMDQAREEGFVADELFRQTERFFVNLFK